MNGRRRGSHWWSPAWLLGSTCLALGCASADQSEGEGVGSVELGVSKCLGGKLGVSNYCSPTCKCDAGEGDCDSAAECNGGNLCVGKGAYFYGIASNACAPGHCGNGVRDAALGETQTDCGGACGNLCPAPCGAVPANGALRHCTADCPCPPREGDCGASDSNCQGGSRCFASQGAYFGMVSTRDVCLANSCDNGVLDGDEQSIDCGPSCRPCSGGYVNALRAGGASFDHGFAVATDDAKNFIVAGRMEMEGQNYQLVKLDSAGALVWRRQLSGPSGGIGIEALGTDNARNIYAVGSLSGTLTVLGTPTSSAGSTDAVVLKISPAGALLWLRRFGAAGAESAGGVAVRGGGEVLVAGSFVGAPDFGSGALSNAGGKDIFALKLTAAGNHVFSKSFGGPNDDQATSIAVDAGGNPTLAGAIESNVDFGTGPVSFNGTVDAFVARLNSVGVCSWARALGSTAADKAFAVAVDATGGPVIAGEFKRTADLGAGAVGTGGGTSAFVVGYTASGGYRFSHALGGNRDDRAMAVVADGLGTAVIGDFSSSNASFGVGGLRASVGGRDVFVVRYDASGAPRWLATFGSPEEDAPRAAVLRDGLLTVVGDYKGNVSFGGPALQSAGGFDMFSARYVY